MTESGFVDKAEGTIKEGAGKLTGDKELEAEGKLDKAQGAVKDAVADVAAGAQALGNKIKDAIDGDK